MMDLRIIKSYLKPLCEIEILRLFCKQVISLQLCRSQDSQRDRRCHDAQRGQALVEYVLLLVIVVTLFYGLSKTFFEPLQRYGTGVFTNTIACSFEYGQLPSEIISEDGCESRYQGSVATNNSSSQSRGNNSQSKSQDTQKSEQTQDSTSSSSGSSGGGESSRSGRGATTIRSRGETLQLGRNSGAEARSTTRLQSEDSEVAGPLSFDPSDSSYRGRRLRRPMVKPIRGELETIVLNKKKAGEVTRSIASTVDGSEKKVKKFTVNTKATDKQQDAASDAPWDIYKILRIILIILMILAILLFVFFQLSQIRKSSA